LPAPLLPPPPAAAQPRRNFAVMPQNPGTMAVQPIFRPGTLNGPLGFFQLPGTRGFQAFAGSPSMLAFYSAFAMPAYARSYPNSYMMSAYSNPYMASYPYMSGYGSNYTGGYGMSYIGGQYPSNTYNLANSAYLTDRTQETSLTVLGVPVERGRVQWPLGLRVLPPAKETKALRDQLDIVLPTVANQAVAGQTNTTLVREG